MNRKLVTSGICVFLFSHPYLWGQHPLKPGADAVRATFLCEVLAKRDKYQGVVISVRVRVDMYRHRTLISDPSCPERNVDLITVSSSESNKSVVSFYRSLKHHYKSGHPIFAMLVGRLMSDSSQTFVASRELVFEMESVSNVSENDFGRGINSESRLD
jgi:hypothetical protein